MYDELFPQDPPPDVVNQARQTMQGFGMAKEFDDWLAGGGARKPNVPFFDQQQQPQMASQGQYQHYSATAEPSSPGFITDQSNRMDQSYRAQQSGGILDAPATPLPSGMGSPMPVPPASLFTPQQQGAVEQAVANNGVRISDGFSGGPAPNVSTFNPQFRADPFMAKDSFMADGPIQTLGVNGFRTGSSRPAYDDWGMQQRAAIDRFNTGLTSILGNQANDRARNELDAQRFSLASADRQDAIMQRRQAAFDRNLQKLPPGQRGNAIAEAMGGGLISNEVGTNMMSRDLLDVASLNAGGISRETGKPASTEKFLRGIVTNYNPARHSRDQITRAIEGMGIRADEIAQYENDPVIGPFVKQILGPAVPYEKPWTQFFKSIPSPGSF